MTIAFCNRVVQCSLAHGYAFPLGASRLKQVANGIQLPSILAQYIESIGSVELASGATIVPHSGDYEAMFPVDFDLMLSPAAILEQAQRPVPPGDWAIDTQWIIEYNDATTRASRSGMRFRLIDSTDLRGRIEMSVSYTLQAEAMLLPKAPQVMTEAEAQLGSCYSFRDYTNRDEWLGLNKELLFDAFTAIPLDPRVIFSGICVAAFSGAQVSTD